MSELALMLLGIKKIYRQEIFDRIVEENRDASHWDMIDLDKISDNLTVKKEKK